MYIASCEELLKLVECMKGSDVLAIDTEFHRERTYRAKLCLIQLATEDANAIVDPLAIEDLTPLAELFEDERMTKVFHAGDQDVEILMENVGTIPHPVFDTQIAAGLLGHPQQMGYGALVKAYCNVSLPKADSYTDWTRRPLSKTQLEYAIDDVLYLPGIYRTMMQQLVDTGRLDWLTEEFSRLSDPASYEVDPMNCWRRLKRVNGLTRKQLAVAQAVAAWREETAMRRNVPRRWILTDEFIVEIAKRIPTTRDELFEIRGLKDRIPARYADEMVSRICKALESDPESWPKPKRRKGGGRNVDGVVDLMTDLVRRRAEESGVATQYIASHDDLVKVARGEDEDIDVLKGWRRELAGDELLDLAAGKIVLGVEDGTLKVIRTDGEQPSQDTAEAE